jgi:hypothetical protein
MADPNKPAMVRVQVLDDQGNPTGMKTVNVDDLKSSSEQRSTLTPDQTARAHALWNRIGLTARTDLDEDGWVQMFSRETDPDRELQVWTAIASTVEELWNDTKFSKQLVKEFLVKAVIGVSIGMVDIPSQCRGVTDKHVAVIRSKLSDAIGKED